MESIIIHHRTGLLICKDCKFAIIPSRINKHFRDSPHKLRPHIRSQIKNYFSHIDNLVTHNHQIKSRIQTFLQSFNQTSSISNLAIYSDGVTCSYCSYISRSRRSIQDHLKEFHDWENPRIRGRKKRPNENDPWQTNVSYQRFFKFGPGSDYFRVNSNRASPNRVPIGPRIEISRERESRASKSDESLEDLDRLRSISHGI